MGFCEDVRLDYVSTVSLTGSHLSGRSHPASPLPNFSRDDIRTPDQPPQRPLCQPPNETFYIYDGFAADLGSHTLQRRACSLPQKIDGVDSHGLAMRAWLVGKA